jgi:hypothetical protein
VGARSGPQGLWRRSRESSGLQGARVVGRLQTSVRRIFPGSIVTIRKDCQDARGSLKRPPDPLTGPDRIAASERVRDWSVRVSKRAQSGPLRPRGRGRSDGRRPGSGDVVVLTRRRCVRAWRGGAVPSGVVFVGLKNPWGLQSGGGIGARRLEATYRIRPATGGVRGPLVRSGFLSRWAQEVSGRREVPSEVIRVPRRGDEG